jgi:hypothetical protein
MLFKAWQHATEPGYFFCMATSEALNVTLLVFFMP